MPSVHFSVLLFAVAASTGRAATAQTGRFAPLIRLEAGTLNPRDPFAATFTWGASLGAEWDDRRAILFRFTRQHFNGDEDADYTTDARTLVTVAGELATAAPNRRKQQLRFRLGGGALFRPGLGTAPVLSAGVAIRYELWPHTSLVGHIEDHAAILPRKDIRGCVVTGPNATCRSVVTGGAWLHNFGLIVALEVR
jgi:hypothetical protein